MSLVGLKVVVTGKFQRGRSEIERDLEAAGADVTGGVSRNTRLLICGEAAGSKLAKAEKLGVPIIDETQLAKLLAGTPLAHLLGGTEKAATKKATVKKATVKKAATKKAATKKATVKKAATHTAKGAGTLSHDPRWTTALRKRLHGFVRPHPNDPGHTAPDLETAWEILRDAPKPKAKARKHATAEVAAVRASFKQAAPPTKLDRNEEIARAMILWPGSSLIDPWNIWEIPRALVALWHEVEGLEFVVGLLLSEAPFSSWADQIDSSDRKRDRTVSIVFDAEEKSVYGPFETDTNWEPYWWALRCRLAVQSDDEFANSVKECGHFFRTTPTTQKPGSREWRGRAALIYAFARETALAEEQVDRYLRCVGEEASATGMMIAAAPDLERAERVSRKTSPYRYSIDMVNSFGVRARPILQRAFDNQRERGTTLDLLKRERYALALIDKWS